MEDPSRTKRWLSQYGQVRGWLQTDLNLGFHRPNASNWINCWARLLFNPCSVFKKFKLLVSLFYNLQILMWYVKSSFSLTKRRRVSWNCCESLLCCLIKLLFHTCSTFKSYFKFIFGVVLDVQISKRKQFKLNSGFDISSPKVVSGACKVDKAWQTKI